MTIAERASNYLIFTNNHPDERDDFASIFEDFVEYFKEIRPFGLAVVFKDGSAFLALQAGSPAGRQIWSYPIRRM